MPVGNELVGPRTQETLNNRLLDDARGTLDAITAAVMEDPHATPNMVDDAVGQYVTTAEETMSDGSPQEITVALSAGLKINDDPLHSDATATALNTMPIDSLGSALAALEQNKGPEAASLIMETLDNTIHRTDVNPDTEVTLTTRTVTESHNLSGTVQVVTRKLTTEQQQARRALVAAHIESGRSDKYVSQDEHTAIGRMVSRDIDTQQPHGGERRAYDIYLKSLRQIRQEQAQDPTIREQLDIARHEQDPDKRQRAYLDALTFAPAVAAANLRSMRGRSSKNLLRDEEIERVSHSPELFKQVIEQSLIDDPALAISALYSIEYGATTKSIREAITAVVTGDLYINSYSIVDIIPTLLMYYPEEEREATAVALASRAAPDSIMKALIDKEAWADILSAEQRQNIASEAFHSEKGGVLPVSMLQKGIDNGFWSLEDVEKKITLLVDAGKEISKPEDIEGISQELVMRAKEVSLDHLISGDSFLSDWAIDNVSLTTDQCNRLVTAFLESDKIATLVLDIPNTTSRFLSNEQMAQIAQRCLDESPDIYEDASKVLYSSFFSEDMRCDYLDKLVVYNPVEFLKYAQYSRDNIISLKDETWIGTTIVQCFETLPFAQVCKVILDDEVYFSSVAEKKQYLLEGINQSQDGAGAIETWDLLRNNASSELATAFSTDELGKILNAAINEICHEESLTSIYRIDINYVEQVFGPERAKQIIRDFFEANQREALWLVQTNSYRFSEAEIDNFISKVIDSDDGDKLFLRHLDLTDSAHSDFANEIVEELINRNPALTILHQAEMANCGYMSDGVDRVFDRAGSNVSKISFAESYLSSTLQRARTAGNPKIQERLLKELSTSYQHITALEKSGMANDYHELRGRLTLDAAGEKSLLELSATLTLLGRGHELDSAKSIEDVYDMLTHGIAEGLSIGRLSSEELRNISKAMEVSSSFAVYAAAKIDDPALRPVLAPALKSMADGSYKEWKYGTIDSFETFQHEGILPQGLSMEQYSEWQIDTISDTEGTFILEAQTAAALISEIVSLGKQDLPREVVEDNPDDIDELAKHMQGLGTEVAGIHKNLQLLRAQPDQDMANLQIVELEKQATELVEQLRTARARYDIATLSAISAESVTSGSIRVGEKEGTPISSILTRLNKNLPTSSYMLDRIQGVLDSYGAQTGEMKKLQVRDSADPRLTFEIGAIPVESCQHYRDGEFNECLLGYTEPNTKIMMLTGEKGKPIARAILRLLEDGNGQPALHIESIYAAQMSDAIIKLMRLHAIAKADALGVPLYASERSQNEVGALMPFINVQGITLIPAPKSRLRSRSSRAPFVYVDSAGGKMPKGKYEMENIIQFIKD